MISQLKNQYAAAQLNYLDSKMTKIIEAHHPDQELKSWGNMEKETLKKYLLNFGFGRWSTIQKKSA
jgi:hypothetical protein